MMSRVFIALILGVSLSGCVSLLPSPAPASVIYRLTSSAQPVAKNSNAEIIRVDRPSANQVFNSTDIVVVQSKQRLSTIAAAQWSEASPIIIQSAMIDALESSREFIGIMPTSGARPVTRLHLSVKNFEANFDKGLKSAPLAVVQYRVTYSRADDRKLFGTQTFRQTVRADSIEVPSVVAAIKRANDTAMADIVSWLERQNSVPRTN